MIMGPPSGTRWRIALRQSLGDIEILIVGDGVDDLTRSIIAELTRKDGRIRFFDFPKVSVTVRPPGTWRSRRPAARWSAI